MIGDSRGWFDLDLDELQKGLGKRPIQLAMGGGCAYPVLAAAVQKLWSRGSKIVFVRLPHSGGLKALEDREMPRAAVWDRVIKDTAAPGIYYEDFPELAGFNCPEWSHLSAGDSVEFSKRLIPHLRAALQM